MPYYKKHTISYLGTIIDKVKSLIYKPVAELSAEAWITPEPVSFSNRMTGEKAGISTGEKWGNLWDCAWFNFTGEVPQSAAGNKVVLLIDLSGEGCLFDSDGCPVRGITNVSSQFDYTLGMPGKRVIQFVECAEGGEKVNIWIEAGCNDLFGEYKDNGTLKQAQIAVCNENIRQLYYDFYVLFDLIQNIPSNSARYNNILFYLNEAAMVLNKYNDEEIVKARDILKNVLEKKGGDPSLNVSAIGHAHIDLAWLWPIRETIRKGGRTFSTVIELMDRYPDYVFGASQPQLYQWTKDRYPSLYEKIRKKIEEGRLEPQGAMWVEADTNISGGEALVRQVLYGKRFFRQEFGQDMKVLWLPDVFGYSAALPQILKKSGVDYFVTSKISWNQFNKMPYDTFVWEGIDGTGILTHFLTASDYSKQPSNNFYTTYVAAITPNQAKGTWQRYQQKYLNNDVVITYGHGDGGGG
jgi:alpha-mannosidase